MPWDKKALCTLEQVPPLWHQGSFCPWMLQESSCAGLAHVCKPSCLSRGKRSSLLPLRCSSPLEQMQSLSLCMEWMFWGGLCWHPPAQCPPDRCDREQGRSGWMADVAAASWSAGICSWNNWLGGGAAPAPSRCAGGAYEPREEALVKVWDLRASLAAKPAVLCKGWEGLGARAPSASVFPKPRSVVVSS